MISNKPNSKYQDLGVDAGKKNVRKIFSNVIENDFPGAFVNIVKDPSEPRKVFTQHMDGDGSKFVQRLLAYCETGDRSVVRGAVDDALQMNLGDIAASGFISGKIVVTDVINIRNVPDIIPKDIIMEELALRFDELMLMYKDYGFNIHFLGGETADLPDQVKSIVLDVAVYAETEIENIISGNVKVGDIIYGLASDGQAVWEKFPNSGIMANGLTLARTCLMSSKYNQLYPDLFGKNEYTGLYKIGEYSDKIEGMSVSDALMSPTRQWSIFIKILIQELKNRSILHMLHGISMNTGGGATKIGHVGNGILYRKNNLPTPPGIFQLIKEEGDVEWREMFENFNCGIGIDIVGQNHPDFKEAVEEVSYQMKIEERVIGLCEPWRGDGNKVVLETQYGVFNDY